ncbi:MAG: CBS domain-containing protein [Candidatus Aenigmatarchaeota archaeon]|nr:MAG: CBS domain-containing protein [Candidatus Aenigmarchaeota archaeon]
MLVKDIMTSDVKTIDPDASVQEAGQIMSNFDIGCVVVAKDGRLLGILTEMDIVRRVVAKNRSPSKTKVKDVMSKELVVIEPDASVEEAAEAMINHKVKKLPVVLANQLLGIVTAMDIVRSQPKLIEQIGKLIFLPQKRLTAG